MTSRVSVIDYGSGNLLSVQRALEHCAGQVVLASTPEQIRRAERLVLPGVGAFADCMSRLRNLELIEPLLEVAGSGRPFLGICVGMQILMETGHEFGTHAGLGLLAGDVQSIPQKDTGGVQLKAPHIGWNRLIPPQGATSRWNDSFLEGGLPGDSQVYFVHSFVAQPDDPHDILAECIYGGHRLCAAVQRENVMGTQFHPEKSAEAGLTLLKRFLDI